MGNLVSQIAYRYSKTLFSFLKREADSAYFNYQTLQFIPNQKIHLTLDEQTRAKFRIPFIEVGSGNYRWQVDCSSFLDGEYSIETHEILAGVEYSTIDNYSVNIENGEVQLSALELSLETAPKLSLFCYIRRTYDDKYYTVLGEFLDFDILSDSQQTRELFRVPFVELEPGKYNVNRSLADFSDGAYTITVYSLKPDGLEIKAGLPSTINILNEKQERGLSFDTVYLSHDTKENDFLRYVKPNGEPIAGASIYVFETNKYVSNSFDGAVGITFTSPDGRWVSPIPVKAGVDYSVVFFLKDKFGPDKIDISM